MVFLDHVQNLHIHAVRAKILWSIFEPEGRCINLTSEVRLILLLIDRLIWPVCVAHRFLRLRFMESWTGTGNSTGNSTTLQPQKAAAIETQYAVRGAYYDH